MRVRCAHAVNRLANYQSGIDLLNEAIKMYPPDEHHNIAVAKWMQGFVYWKLVDQSEKARVAWQQNKESFADLGRMFLEGYKENWYQQQVRFMRDAIKLGNELNGWIAKNQNDTWKIHGLDAAGVIDKNIGEVFIDRLLIDGEPYQFVPQVEIERNLFKEISKQYVIQFNHDHMARIGMTQGSYLVASFNIDAVESGDTVLAVLNGAPSPVVLRRYIRDSGNIFLRAASRNYYRDLEFPESSKDFNLCGKVLAQLVPL